MPFAPISLPTNEILLTNFVTDIATITNANILLIQAQLEDLINTLEIDVPGNSIGTTNPILFLKTNSVILQDTGLIFQSGSPIPTTIASLTKNGSDESVFQIDHLITNIDATFDIIDLNTLTVNTLATFDGTSEFNAPITINSSVVESEESVILNLTWNGVSTSAESTITLTNTSKQNIYITLKATTAPTANPVYDGTGALEPTLTAFNINIDFDATNPPVENTKFTFYLVDVTNSLSSSIAGVVQSAGIEIKLVAGTNQSTSTAILLHDNTNKVGIPDTTQFVRYGTNITLNYILDSLNDDRLLVTSLVGAEIF
jgi:hypothetical protein